MSRESKEKAKAAYKKKKTEMVGTLFHPQNLYKWTFQPDEYKGELFVLSNIFSEEAKRKGCVAAVATFLLLKRREIGKLGKRLFARRTYQLDAPPSSSGNNQKRSMIPRVLRFGFDIAISSYVGLFVLTTIKTFCLWPPPWQALHWCQDDP